MKFSGFFILLLFVLTLCTALRANPSWADTETVTQTITLVGGTTYDYKGKTFDGQGNCRIFKVQSGHVVLENCVIKNGSADAYMGGGILVDNDASLTVRNCRFEGNTASYGGAIYANNGTDTIIIENCTFANNTATYNEGNGGGGVCLYSKSATITNCTFTGNNGGGAYLARTGDSNNKSYEINFCTFVNNSDSTSKEIDYSTTYITSNVNVKNSIVYGAVSSNVITDNCLSSSNITSMPISEDVTVTSGDTTITHTVFRKYAQLSAAIDKGNDTSVTTDQLGNDVTNGKHDIGAVEITGSHAHSFIYSASGATITATCSGAGTCGLTDKKATLTVVAPTNLVYDGTAKSATISGSIPGVSNPSIVYNPSEPVNAGTYTASITLGNATASVNFTITKRNATVTAKAQTVYVNGSINTGTGYAELSNALTGHSLSSVTLTASSTVSATANGTITPSNAIIKDGSNNDVTANYDITYQTGTLTVTVTVTASVPKNLTFDKASITIDFDVDEGISVSDSVNVTVKDENGNDITALGEIVCEKTTPDFDELTSTVDGNKITFTVPAGADPESKTVQFTVKFRYDGKDYLVTSYRVVVYRTKLGDYYLTLSPVKITVIPGRTASLDLKNSVKFEKVFLNNHRQTVEDAKMKFSLLSGATSWINCDSDSGVVTLNPGADVENGTLKYSYKVEAEYDGNSETDIADFKVNVVKGSPAITTATLPTAMTGNVYSQTLTATGASPITWTKTGGELPDGLTLNASTGKISGTPSDSGGGKTFKFTVQASNAYGTDSREFSIGVILTKDAAPGSWK